MTNPLAFLVAAVTIAACASPGVPPGGPVDIQAPQIVGIAPDSGAVGSKPKELIFRFDEVVSERPTGAASLGALFLISPREGEPRVDWNRNEIAIRPRRGWRNNTTYTVTLLPGLADLRGNVRNTGAMTMFSTGTSIPGSRIVGTVFNWPEARVITRGLIEARPRSDTSLAYIATTDSAGGFALRNMPPGAYLVRALGDENSNRGLDPREPWDTVAVALADSARLDLYTFVHDSLGARVQSAAVRDSVTVEITFDNALSASPLLTAASIRIRAPDSTEVGIASVTPPPADTTAAVRRLARPIPPRSLIVRLTSPLRLGASYRIRVTDARNLAGVVRSSETILKVPAAFPAPAVKPPAITRPPVLPAPVLPPPAPPVRR